jgi:hypothetical protein
MKLRHLLTLATLAATTPLHAAPPTHTYDLVVYGATASGIATAVAASREGLHVVLVDPSHHIGGLVAGGLSHTDTGDKSVIGGFAHEFFARLGAHYNEPIEYNFEPHAATLVFESFLHEAHIETIFDSPLDESHPVDMQGTTIQSIHTLKGVFRAKIFADCTYEGELLGFAKVSYTWGREPITQYNEPNAGVRPRQRPDHLFNVQVSPYLVPGNPASGLLPEINPGTPGPLGTGDKKVQAYGFRMCITRVASNEIPFPKPANYSPARYELLARWLDALAKQKGRDPVMHDVIIMSPLKGDKFDINSFGAFSTDHIGASWNFPTSDARGRAAIWQDHYDYEAGFFYYLGHSEKIAPSLRAEINSYGLAKDEFTDTAGWPWQLYIRESRRMLGTYIMTQHDIQDTLTKPDSIGMGSYESDSHGVERIATPDGFTQNEGEMYTPVHPYQIPYRLILPKQSETANLLVPVCFSASHVAYSTLRMEPQYMIIGQAAGTAAALAIHHKTSLYNIPIPELQAKLRSQQAILELPTP